jgi:GH24 family phage-related lysozyme (muramidase)
MNTSGRGLALIRKWEGLYLKAYKDIAGIWTIGYGSVNNKQLGISVSSGKTITKEQAAELMAIEVRDKDKTISKLVKVPLTQYQFDTLSSFTYNVGTSALKNSTLLRLLNRSDYTSVPNQLMRWSYAYDEKNEVRRQIQGLKNRRNDEVLMWLGKAVPALPPLAEEFTREKVVPQINAQAGKQVVQSRTAKVVATKWGLLTAAAYQNPDLALLLLGVGLCGVYVLYRKYMDAREIF